MSWTTLEQNVNDAAENLTVQNQVVLLVKRTNNPTGNVAITIDGDFDSGVVQVGYLNSSAAFIMFTDATSSSNEGYKLTTGDRAVYARATGASPDINIEALAAE